MVQIRILTYIVPHRQISNHSASKFSSLGPLSHPVSVVSLPYTKLSATTLTIYHHAVCFRTHTTFATELSCMLPSDRVPRMRIDTLALAISAYFITIIIIINNTALNKLAPLFFLAPNLAPHWPCHHTILPFAMYYLSSPALTLHRFTYGQVSVCHPVFPGTEFMNPCSCSVVNHHHHHHHHCCNPWLKHQLAFLNLRMPCVKLHHHCYSFIFAGQCFQAVCPPGAPRPSSIPSLMI